MSLRFAYNTNGLQNHRLEDAARLVAEAGYAGLDVTLDIHHLDPFAPRLDDRARRFGELLAELGLGAVIETGARFLLDPRAKHEPTLVSPETGGRACRVALLRAAIDVAAVLGAEAVGYWAGAPRAGVDREEAWPWLMAGVRELHEYAGERGVVAALEPEPGMLVETLEDFRRVQAEVPGLALALDVGHLLVTGERDPADAIREFRHDLATVAVEDMARGVHVHLPFGEGDLDLRGTLDALEEIGWGGLVCVELSRDSHRAHEMVPRTLVALRG